MARMKAQEGARAGMQARWIQDDAIRNAAKILRHAGLLALAAEVERHLDPLDGVKRLLDARGKKYDVLDEARACDAQLKYRKCQAAAHIVYQGTALCAMHVANLVK